MLDADVRVKKHKNRPKGDLCSQFASALRAGFLSCVCLSGCVTGGKSSSDYTPPRGADMVVHETIVNEPFETVWDRLVGKLASGFFVINNIDKASRLINVSYSSDSPGEYIDCGRSRREFSFQGESRAYDYAVADSSTYKADGGTWGEFHNLPRIVDIARRTAVEGRINLYVAPVNASQTRVSANVKYILKVDLEATSTAYNGFGKAMSQSALPPHTREISFSTSEPATKDWGTGGVTQLITCRTNGKLEQSLLNQSKP